MLARSLVPGPHKCWIAVAAPTAPAACNAEPLARLGKIAKLRAGIRVKNHGADGHFQHDVVARLAVAIGAFAVATALCVKLAIVAIAQESVVVRIRFEVNVAAVAAVAARWPASRDILLPAERHAAVSAVAAFYQNFSFVCEHKLLVTEEISKKAYSNAAGK